MADQIPLFYTFGNHMHWVDMEWLWGYHVLPGSIRDMIKYCRETGAEGCINFDGIGYEKLAVETPEALVELRAAIAKGMIEPVGCSYGQPYGLFQGGESNVRQRIYGCRSVMRLLGVRPRTFWEEEFDFCPQLPQILSGVGINGASLFFQWTWHTPEVPLEKDPIVWWRGIDGSELLCTTRNRLNLHQWPEDFRILLDNLASEAPSLDGSNVQVPLVQQWLELMPSPDWMCRSELISPMLQEFVTDNRFQVQFSTLGNYLDLNRGGEHPVREYSLDEVWHGMTLGKNWDNHPKTSARLEESLLAAETVSAILGVFGRPYEPWEVYPVWEYEECWRNLLAAQHHDNHECEGLCGHVAQAQFSYVEQALSKRDPLSQLAARLDRSQGQEVAFNRHSFGVVFDPHSQETVNVPPVGYCVMPSSKSEPPGSWKLFEQVAVFESGQMSVEVSLQSGRVTKLSNRECALSLGQSPFPAFEWQAASTIQTATSRSQSAVDVDENRLMVMLDPDSLIAVWYEPVPQLGALDVRVSFEPYDETFSIDPGLKGALKSLWNFPFEVGQVFADSPYAVYQAHTGSRGRRKYPEGEWMTSPQWFEEVAGAFTAQTFVDFVFPNGSGLLIAHSGAQQWFFEDGHWSNVLLAIDPWDGTCQELDGRATYRLIPHGATSHSKRVEMASGLRGKLDDIAIPSTTSYCPISGRLAGQSPALPAQFSFLAVENPNVHVTAVYRESEDYSGRDLEDYVGNGMGYPYVLRLVEYDGRDSNVELTVAGPVAKAFKTNLMGEPEVELVPVRGDDSKLTPNPKDLKAFGIEAHVLKFKMRPFEIATLYLDIVPGRKQVRDLDAKREVWATVHRTPG